MGSYRQTLLYNLPTVVTPLAGETRVHSYDLVPSTCSLCTENSEERAPAGVHDGFRKMVVFHHVADSQVFHHNPPVALCIWLSRLEMMIAPLPIDLEMCLRHILRGFPSAMRTFLTAAQLALLPSECSLRGAIETWVRNGVPLAVSKKGLEAHVNADVRMSAVLWCMLSLWKSLTDDEGIPMSISPQHKMDGLGYTLYRTMQLDLEEVSQLLRHNKVLLLLMQVTVFAVLPQLDRVPAIGLLEPREADTRKVMRFGSEETFEGLGKPIRKHLYGCGGNMFTSMTFESLFQIRLAGEGALVLILLFDHLKHLIIDLSRFSQASHEQAGLFLIHVQSVLKCFHVLYYSSLESVCQPFRPPAGGRQFTHMPEGRGPLAAFLVEREFFYVHHYSQPT